jgi:hypothetical protein
LRTRGIPVLAIAILFLLLVPIAYETSSYLNSSRALSYSSSDPYSENLSLYVTSSQALWKADLIGGNINLNVTVPSSVSVFTVSLTHYNTWNSAYEVFTTHGFKYLGLDEPMSNASLLEVRTTVPSDATSLASALSQKFAMNYLPITGNSTTFFFLSPMNFNTEMHIFFWNLLPRSAGGFANMTTEQNFESQGLAFFKVFYSGGSYSISYGGIHPLSSSSTFLLYSQLGLTAMKYSSAASSSGVQIHVLGGLVANSSISANNSPSSVSSVITLSRPTSGNNFTVPNISASLDFSFPTIVAYRQVGPLDPAANSTVSVTVTVKDIGASGSPSAKVSFNDSWYSSLSGATLQSGSPSATYNMSSGQTNTTVYFVTMPSSFSSPFNIPATPVNYSFKAANQIVNETSKLNNETLIPSSSTAAALETIANPISATITAGQPLSLNIFVKNYSPSEAAGSIAVAGHSPFSLGPSSSKNFTVTAGPTSLSQISTPVVYGVTWTDASGNHLEDTNSFSGVFSFGNPGSPSTTLSKSISVSSTKKTADVILTVSNGGSTALSNLTIFDPFPSGISFLSSQNKSLTASSSSVSIIIANLSASASLTYRYNVTVSNPSENYVFLPANVSANWNGITVSHYSQGAGVALGVTGTKFIVPNAGFQGTSVAELQGVNNNGSLPIYDVTFANSSETFLSNLNSSNSYTPVLNTGQSVNSTINVNMTGLPGIYNTSTVGASFVFAGSNETARSNVFRVTIYQDLFSVLNALGPRIEENHNINISITITNPSNATVSNVSYSLKLPPTVSLVSGSLSYQISSMAPHQNVTKSFEVSTSIPFQYTISGGNLTFQYQGRTLRGVTNPLILNIVDDLFTRYGIPIFVAILIVIGTLLYVRRLVRKPS